MMCASPAPGRGASPRPRFALASAAAHCVAPPVAQAVKVLAECPEADQTLKDEDDLTAYQVAKAAGNSERAIAGSNARFVGSDWSGALRGFGAHPRFRPPGGP